MLTIVRNFPYCVYRLICHEDFKSPRTEGRVVITIMLLLMPSLLFLYKNKPLTYLPNGLYLVAPIIILAIAVRLIDHKKWSRKADPIIKKIGYWRTYFSAVLIFAAVFLAECLTLK